MRHRRRTSGAGDREYLGGRLHRLPAGAGRLHGRHARAGRRQLGHAADRRHQRAAGGRLKAKGGGPSAAALSIAAMRSHARADRRLWRPVFLRRAAPSSAATRRRSTPTRDDEVIEVLPASAGSRGEDRQLRKRLAARPDDARARDRGRAALPRAGARVGRSALRRPRAGGAARLARCRRARPTTCCCCARRSQQYLHEFDAAVAHLRLLLARPGSERTAAGLADAGDGAARAGPLRRLGRGLPRGRRGRRRAVRDGLPGRERGAARRDRRGARELRGAARRCRGLPPATRGWLTTSLAELEERDGRAAAADAAYRGVLQPRPRHLRGDRLCRLPDRAAAARRGARGAEGRDAHRHRRCCAWRSPERSRSAARRARDVAEMRERIALANERPEARVFHGREQAMFALVVERDAGARARARARRRRAASASRSTCSSSPQAARASGEPRRSTRRAG